MKLFDYFIVRTIIFYLILLCFFGSQSGRLASLPVFCGLQNHLICSLPICLSVSATWVCSLCKRGSSQGRNNLRWFPKITVLRYIAEGFHRDPSQSIWICRKEATSRARDRKIRCLCLKHHRYRNECPKRKSFRWHWQ